VVEGAAAVGSLAPLAAAVAMVVDLEVVQTMVVKVMVVHEGMAARVAAYEVAVDAKEEGAAAAALAVPMAVGAA
jgi:hypothetical protein